MTRALTLIAGNRIDATTGTSAIEANADENAFAAFHNDLQARSKITAFTGGLNRRGF